MTTIALGCSTDRDYAFLLPITCLLWRDRIGHRPLALLVRDEAHWLADRRLAVVLSALRHHDIAVRFVGLAEGYPDHTTAQNCRQHAAALTEIPDDEWIVPADADLWPLRRDYYHLPAWDSYKAVFLYANGDHFQGREITLARSSQGLGTQTLPTCHAALRARDWRAIYSLIPDDVSGSVKKSLDAWLPSRTGREASFSLWMSDQQLMTEAVCQQTWFPSGPPPGMMGPSEWTSMFGKVLMVNRYGHPPVDRLCRSVENLWCGDFDPARWVDAHVHKNPDSDEHWADELKIVDAVIPQHSAWARKYAKAHAETSR